MKRTIAAAALILTAVSLSGCVRQPLYGQPANDLDRKYSKFAWIEEGQLITLIVDTRPTRDRDGNAYMPLEIAIANRGLKRLTLTRESFTLLDAEGNRYPAAGPAELISGYDYLDVDRQLGELPTIGNKFAAFARYPSNFSPVRNVSFNRSNVVRDLVQLPKHGYLMDFIYFPTPPTGILNQRFELFVNAPELEDPVFVRFEVR